MQLHPPRSLAGKNHPIARSLCRNSAFALKRSKLRSCAVEIAAHETGLGTLSGFAWILDLDDINVQQVRLKSEASGVHLGGKLLFPDFGRSIRSSAALESDHDNNSNDFSALYLTAYAAIILCEEVKSYPIDFWRLIA